MKHNYNAHQRAIMNIIREEIDIYVGGQINTTLDYNEDTEEYKEAYASLYEVSAKDLLKEFYDMVMNKCRKGTNAEHARFAGSLFIYTKLGAYIMKNELGKEFHK